MSFKNMVIRVFGPKKYKIIKFNKAGDKQDVYIVLYKRNMFSGYNYVLRNNILNIIQAALEGDNFSPRVYVKKELGELENYKVNKVPFAVYDGDVIEKFYTDDFDKRKGILLGRRCIIYSLDKCEEIIENHKEIMKLAEIIKKEEKQKEKIKNRERKKSKAKTVKRY